ncbi:MAG TPA: TetR family transcriptional regulator [Solirubrobacteraceae bacterium]
MEAATVIGEGLRERKKRQTREAIAAAAMSLFEVRGFDDVTIAEIARAADVSEKTISNYFPAKEDLVFGRRGERRDALVEAIRERAPGESIVGPFRDATTAFLDRVEHDPVESIVAIPRLVAQSTALRNSLSLSWEEESAVLAPVIAEAAGEDANELLPAAVARTLAWTHRLAFRAAFTRLLAGEHQATVAADLRRQADRAYDRLEAGLADFATAGPPVGRSGRSRPVRGAAS